jgi:hypothetical protein
LENQKKLGDVELRFFRDGKSTWPDRGLESEEYNEFRRQQKASEQLHEIKLQNSLAKIFLGFFLLLLSISFVAFLAGDAGLASGILFIVVLKFPTIGGFCIYKIIRNKLKKRKLDFHMSNNSLTAIYDWDNVKCRQCGGTDLAEIKSDAEGLEEQIRKGEVVLRLPHHKNAALQCNGCGNWGLDCNRLDSNLNRNLDGKCMIVHCPRCGSTDPSMIIWGMPDPFFMEHRRERGDDVIYGGCSIPGDNPPDKSCNNCGHQWR